MDIELFRRKNKKKLLMKLNIRLISMFNNRKMKTLVLRGKLVFLLELFSIFDQLFRFLRRKYYGISIKTSPVKPKETDLRYIYDYQLQIPTDEVTNDVPKESCCSRKRRSTEYYNPFAEYEMDRIRRQSEQTAAEPNQSVCKSERAIRLERNKKRTEMRMDQLNQRRADFHQRREEVVGAALQRRDEHKQLHTEMKMAAQEHHENLKQKHQEMVGAAQQKHQEIRQKHLDTHHQRKQDFRQKHEEIVGAAQQRREEIMTASQQRRAEMRARSETRFSEHQKLIQQRMEDAHNRHEQFVGATQQKHEELRSRLDESSQQRQQRLQEMRSRFRTRSQDSPPPRQNEFNSGFDKNFEGEVAPRERRSTPNGITQIPTVMSTPGSCGCASIESLRAESRYDERLQAPEYVQYMPELQSDGPSDSKESTQKFSRHCQSNYYEDHQLSQPQYYQRSEGQLVPYTLGSTQYEQTYTAEPAEPRYVYDRLGQTYLENDGKLRLMAPSYEGQPEPSNTEMIREILSENREVMDELNSQPGRVLPKASDLIKEGIDYLHDIARRDVSTVQIDESPEDYPSSDETMGAEVIELEGREPHIQVEVEKEEKRRVHVAGDEEIIAAVNQMPSRLSTQKRKSKSKSDEEDSDKALSEEESGEIDLKTQRMYQVMPFQQDDRDGSVIVKIFSTDEKSEEKSESRSNGKKPRNGNKIVQKPKIETVKRGDKEYDVLTIFEDPDTNSQEELQKIIKHLNESKKSNQQ